MHCYQHAASSIHSSMGFRSMYRRFGKRAFDILVASIVLFGVWPLMLLTAIVVRARLGAPILFTQVRIGRNGRKFSVYKFRSMSDTRDRDGNLLSDKQRLTPTGRLLRDLSLDELPQLWNVLRGDMSLIGPRPLLVEYMQHYSPQQARRHEMRPGITGWAQVNGRNVLGWEQRFEHDVHYVENASFVLDIKILLLTVVKVFLRKDVNSDARAITQKFRGSLAPE